MGSDEIKGPADSGSHLTREPGGAPPPPPEALLLPLLLLPLPLLLLLRMMMMMILRRVSLSHLVHHSSPVRASVPHRVPPSGYHLAP